MDPTSQVVPDWVRVAVSAYQAIGPIGVIVLTSAGVVCLFAWRLRTADLRAGIGRIWHDITRAGAALFDIHRRHREAKIRALESQEALFRQTQAMVDRRSSPVALVVDAELEPPDRDDPRVSGTRRRHTYPDD